LISTRTRLKWDKKRRKKRIKLEQQEIQLPGRGFEDSSEPSATRLRSEQNRRSVELGYKELRNSKHMLQDRTETKRNAEHR
jgi:hypothetical protein